MSAETYNTPLAKTTVSHYDPANNIRSNRSSGRSDETKGFDALNRITWHRVQRQVPGQNPVNLNTHFYYYPSGTLQKVADAKGHDTTFAYDASDRRITMTYTPIARPSSGLMITLAISRAGLRSRRNAEFHVRQPEPQNRNELEQWC